MQQRVSLWARIASVGLLLLIAACSSQPTRAPRTYTVKAGDTLYSIAMRYGVDYRELARSNGIGNDYRIRVGQALRFPTARMPGGPTTASKSTSIEQTVLPPSNIVWHWPTASTSYAATTRPNGGRGLLVKGTGGQDIRAVAAGKVVYTGSGLLGYGQLVIVKHDDTYLSAYGHLQAVLVHEGEQVSIDQKIATMGNGPAGTPLLYFEIRANGQPIDPLPLLLPQQ
jgi:lipoprotein NlpD